MMGLDLSPFLFKQIDNRHLLLSLFCAYAFESAQDSTIFDASVKSCLINNLVVCLLAFFYTSVNIVGSHVLLAHVLFNFIWHSIGFCFLCSTTFKMLVSA